MRRYCNSQNFAVLFIVSLCSLHWEARWPLGKYKSGCFWPDRVCPKTHSIEVNFPDGEKNRLTKHERTCRSVAFRLMLGGSCDERLTIYAWWRWTHAAQRNTRGISVCTCDDLFGASFCAILQQTALMRPPTEYTLNVTDWPAARCVEPGVYLFYLIYFFVLFTTAARELRAAVFVQPAIQCWQWGINILLSQSHQQGR